MLVYNYNEWYNEYTFTKTSVQVVKKFVGCKIKHMFTICLFR